MERRDFVKLTGAGMGAIILPVTGNIVTAAELLDKPMDVGMKKQLADIALNTARAAGATYADARIGRYLNQFVTTREKVVNNIVNTESAGIGIRVSCVFTKYRKSAHFYWHRHKIA